MTSTAGREQQMPSNKEIAWSWFQALNDRHVDDAMSMLDDAGTWWNVGPRVAVPMRTFKESAAAIMKMMPMRFTLHGAIAEEGTVLLEIESLSPKPGGGTYNNRYCYVMQVANGRIMHVREYPDTKYSAEMLPPEAWELEKASWKRHHAGEYWYSDDAEAPRRTE